MPQMGKRAHLRKCKNGADVIDYARSIVDGKKKACKPLRAACKRFLNDLENPKWEFRLQDAEFVIRFIETCIAHKEGERLDGTPLLGQPFILEPWEKFIIYNLLGFFIAGNKRTPIQRGVHFYSKKERKNAVRGALALALALLERASGSRILIIGASLKQATQSFSHIVFNLERMGELENFRVLDNNAEHSLSRQFYDENEQVIGSLFIEALAAKP